MKHSLNPFSESRATSVHGRAARVGWPAGIALVVAVGALACSEESPSSSLGIGGTGGQTSAPTAGTGIVAGTSNTPTAGTPAATSGAAGMGTSGTGTGGGSAGTGGSSVGTGGSGGAAGGSAGSGGSGGSGGAPEDGWVPLFNGTNLDGWIPSQGHAGLFAAGKVGEDAVIHVYPSADLQDKQQNVPQASLRTDKSYSSYVLHLEYKWGIKRFNDRQGARDNGICFHICNTPSVVWPDSVELQIGSDAWGNDWVTGNIFMLVNKTRAKWPWATLNGKSAFSETGTQKSLGAPASYALGYSSAQLDKPNDWNIIELTVHGAADAEYKVNGTVVNRLFDMECSANGTTFAPLDRGPIALQAEFAEVYFRNIKIKVLP